MRVVLSEEPCETLGVREKIAAEKVALHVIWILLAHGRDTKAELAVRWLVHAQGLCYRVSAGSEADLRRAADLLSARARVAVFIDECYWHGCLEHFTMPGTDLDYWSAKIGRNRGRDAETTVRLDDRKWLVLRFREHELPASVAARIGQAVRARSARVNY